VRQGVWARQAGSLGPSGSFFLHQSNWAPTDLHGRPFSSEAPVVGAPCHPSLNIHITLLFPMPMTLVPGQSHIKRWWVLLLYFNRKYKAASMNYRPEQARTKDYFYQAREGPGPGL
jgi:hypothetical protein